MRTWLSAAVAAGVLIFAMAGVASAAPGSNGNGNSKGKGSLPPIDTSNAANCDFIAEPGNALCLLPFPDDYYTRPDASSPTGRRVDLNTEGDAGQRARASTSTPPPTTPPTASAPARRSCSRCPGSTPPPTSARPARCRSTTSASTGAPNAPVVVIDASTGKRWPIWVEIDSNAADPAKAALEIHPAVNFASGHRYIVALRNLRNAAGEETRGAGGVPLLPRQPALRSRTRSTPGASTSKDIFKTLQKARDRPQRPLPRLGLHGRQRPEQRRPRARDARRRLRPARRHRPRRRLIAAGQLADVHRDEHRRTNRTRARSRGGSKARSWCRATCSRAAGPAGRCSSTPNGAPDPERRLDRPTSTASSPPRRRPAPAGTGAPVALRPRPVRHRRRGRLGPAAPASPRNTTSSSARPTRSACRESDVPVAIGGPAEPLALPGAPRPPPAGPARRALPRPGDDQPERLHDRRRLPPGRHPGHAARCSTPATSTTTATARAGSWAAP